MNKPLWWKGSRIPKYKWDNPLEWLEEKLMNAAGPRALPSQCNLLAMALLMAERLSFDEIQDIFQEEMAGDGYLEPLAQEEKDSTA